MPQLQFDGHGRFFEGLAVGVAHHESYVVYAFPVHVVDGIAASASYTDHFNDFRRIGREIELYYIFHNYECFLLSPLLLHVLVREDFVGQLVEGFFEPAGTVFFLLLFGLFLQPFFFLALAFFAFALFLFAL